MFKVEAMVIQVVNNNCSTFIVQATGWRHFYWPNALAYCADLSKHGGESFAESKSEFKERKEVKLMMKHIIIPPNYLGQTKRREENLKVN
jgi:hypothetical protein